MTTPTSRWVDWLIYRGVSGKGVWEGRPEELVQREKPRMGSKIIQKSSLAQGFRVGSSCF